MSIANWLTLTASVVALLSVVLSYRTNKKQLENANELALKQINAAAAETSRRLKAEILLKEKQTWIKEFRETINELLYLGDPFLDGPSGPMSVSERGERITRLAHKVDLMLPVGTTHAARKADDISGNDGVGRGMHPGLASCPFRNLREARSTTGFDFRATQLLQGKPTLMNSRKSGRGKLFHGPYLSLRPSHHLTTDPPDGRHRSALAEDGGWPPGASSDGDARARHPTPPEERRSAVAGRD